MNAKETIVSIDGAEHRRVAEPVITRDRITVDDAARARKPRQRLGPDGAIDSEAGFATQTEHPRAEAFRALRTRLLIRLANAGIDAPVLAIVSPASGDGRSQVSANLAVAFAQTGERTLLIDADMRAPQQHLIFDIPGGVGLSAVLAGRADLGTALPLPQFGALSVLPAGALPSNPQELLSRPQLISLLADCRNEFDLVLIDTPAALRYADAQLIAFRAGSALLLARRNRSRVKDAERVIRELDETGARLLGTVLTVF